MFLFFVLNLPIEAKEIHSEAGLNKRNDIKIPTIAQGESLHAEEIGSGLLVLLVLAVLIGSMTGF